MSEFIGQYQYVIAWSFYLIAGLFFALFWWRFTSVVGHAGWRDLLRGLSLVFIFTPWYAGETQENMAPATMVVLMDLLVGNTENGVRGALVLLVSLGLMLAVLLVRRLKFAKEKV